MTFVGTARRCISAVALCMALGVGLSATASAAPANDTSPAARNNFAIWWNYENVIRTDSNVTSQTAYGYGLNACDGRNRGQSNETIAKTIVSNSGLTRSGTEGVMRSAFESMCPLYRGFKSHFDREVDIFISLSTKDLQFTPTPSVFDYGWFLRRACEGLDYGGYNHITILPYLRTLRETAIARNLNDQQLTDMLNKATAAWCITS